MDQFVLHITLLSFGKVWTHFFSTSSYGYIIEKLGSLVLVRQPVQEKKNSEFKQAVLHLENWLCVAPFR